MALISTIRSLYHGNSRTAHRFRYGLLVFDLSVILFIVFTSFIEPTRTMTIIDCGIGIIILLDFSARMLVSRHRMQDLLRPSGIADLIVIVSLLAPLVGGGFAFLRVVRTLRVFRSYQLLGRLRLDFPYFRRNEQTIVSATNLAVFVFVMTALVYETQHESNPQIGNYADALYFTVTALTTTGFGDITLSGSEGRLLSVAIMIFGVSLFLRLVQVLIRPPRVEHECPDCGLKVHESDAIHCKHCGQVLHIENEGWQ